MSERHYPPAYLRYLKARLLTLGKPSFWVTAIFLSVIGLVIREYWSNPNMFSYNQNQEVTSLESDQLSLSPEDRAVTADIDNLPALIQDFEPGNLPVTGSTYSSKSRSNNNEKLDLIGEINQELSANTLVSESGMEMSNSTSLPAGDNPFISEAKNLLQRGAFNIGNQSSGMNSSAAAQSTGTAGVSDLPGIGVNQISNGQNTSSILSSQTPRNQSSIPGLSTLNAQTLNEVNVLGQTSAGGVMQTPHNNGLPSPNFSPSTELNTGTGIQPTGGVPNNFPANSFNNVNNIQDNFPVNSFNNVNNIQGLPRPVQPTTTTSPMTSGMETGVQTGMQTNTAPNSLPAPNPDNVTPMSPVVADSNGNLMWRSPSQQMESNSLDSRQIPGQNTNTVENNNFDFSNFEF